MSDLTPLRITQTGLAFWQAKCLLSAIELGVFTALGAGAKTRAALGDELGVHATALPDFLDGLVAMGFLEREGQGALAEYRNGAEARQFLDRGSDEYMAGYLEMANSRLYPFWAGLTDTLRTGRPQNEVGHSGTRYFDALYQDEQRLDQYLQAMAGMSRGNFRALAERFDFSPFRTMADIGGASGELAVVVARRYPGVRCVTADLAPVQPLAARRVAEAGLSDRVEAVVCDMFIDPFPEADILTMGMVLHNWSPDAQQALVRKAYETLPPGGAFIVIEHLIDDERRENLFGLMMSLNMLVACGNAADFTGADLTGWMRQAGFREARVIPLLGPCSAGIAWK
ncbi:MAG: methyltransferase domain-containing protein [Acidobacteria bacterium]|nr:methyltransferase domain-containing protein [Acidobacteriota bacterium]